jgi:hypothetical protein
VFQRGRNQLANSSSLSDAGLTSNYSLTMIFPLALPDSINRCASRISSKENTATGFACYVPLATRSTIP